MIKELMMFYNVENFFPSDQNKDSKKSDLYNWDDYKYNQKLRRINHVLQLVKEEKHNLPFVIGLAEIGSEEVLIDLINTNSQLENYQYLYQKSLDSRGLNVALLYNDNKAQLLNHQFLRFENGDFGDYETRDILQTEFLYQGNHFHIFVLHLPSKREQDHKKQLREYLVDELSDVIGSLKVKNEPIIIMGDFNENPNEGNLEKLLLKSETDQFLINPFQNFIHKKQYTTFHRKQGVVFDQIIYSENLLNNINYNTSVSIFNHIKLKNGVKKHHQFPSRTYSGSRYIGGYSDHFPILLELAKTK